MIILGIETSCDETAAAIVKNGTQVLSSVVSSSQSLHKKYGGIIPEEAAREQVKCIIPVIEEAVKSSTLPAGRQELKIENLDALAVTVEPGLIGSLLIGVETAKTLSFALEKPLVPVNHLIAHIYANFIEKTPKLPAICLVASGGHTELFLMKSHQKFQWLGGTRDDAAGECFDKCSRLLQLGYPGGPAIEQAASEISNFQFPISNKFKLPRPMINQKNLDFSFAGLKTAVARLIEKSHKLQVPSYKSQVASEIQEAITDCLVAKTLKAAKEFYPKSILIAGGVAANQRLREKLKKEVKTNLFIPEKKYCTDNAVVVASRAFFNFKPVSWKKVRANPSLRLNT